MNTLKKYPGIKFTLVTFNSGFSLVHNTVRSRLLIKNLRVEENRTLIETSFFEPTANYTLVVNCE